MKKTLLWAMHGYCVFGCSYCYFRHKKNNQNELIKSKSLDWIINQIVEAHFKRVFIAGAEPLAFSDLFSTVEQLKRHKIDVIVCTNGYLLSDDVCSRLIESGVDAVSLDSFDQDYNDKMRGYPNGRGTEQVINGIKTFLAYRKSLNRKSRIGVYSVVTRKNIGLIKDTYLALQKLGIDYYMYQPVYIEETNELSLSAENLKLLRELSGELYNSKQKTRLPIEEYLKAWYSIYETQKTREMDCRFAGKDLFFLTYEGILYQCPSEQGRGEGIFLGESFIEKSQLSSGNCSCFSEDCVNMIQLVNFDHFLETSSEKSSMK